MQRSNNRTLKSMNGSRFSLRFFLLHVMFVGLAMFFCKVATAETSLGPLKVHPKNSRYLTDDSGRAIYLTGSHTWLNLQDGGTKDSPRIFDYGAFLDLLEDNHHNFFRLWNWEGSAWTWDKPERFKTISPLPYKRTGPGMARDGLPKFDVHQLNQAYFYRLRERVILAGKRNIYVGVKLFEGFSIASKSKHARKKNGTPWVNHPFHRDNNINGIDGDPNNDGEGYESHTLAIDAIREAQDRYARKIIDTVNDLDNVIYEVSNESHGGSTKWQYHWIQRIRDYEKTKPKQHPIWMSFQWDGFDIGKNASLFDSKADIVAPGWQEEPAYVKSPPVADGSKVVILDTDHINPRDRKRISWVWKTFTRGMHPMLMDDPFLDVKSNKDMIGAAGTRRAMGDTLRYAEKLDLASTEPTDNLEHCSTGYCLQNPGHEYLVFQPKAGPFKVALKSGAYRYEWFHPRNHKVVEQSTIRAESGLQEFIPPFDGAAVLYLKNTNDFATVGPRPGDVFREYHWSSKGPKFVSGDSKNPRYTHKGKTFGVSMDIDLEDATKAEVVVEHWSGHFATSGKAIQFNKGAWLELPMPKGSPGLPERYVAIINQPAIDVPLATLRDGVNKITFRCGPQLTRYSAYAAFGVYGITLRIYYDSSRPHPKGRIISPKAKSSIGDNPKITVQPVVGSAPIARVDVMAEYKDFNWEGDGVFRQWHYEYRFTKLDHHVGTTTSSPYEVTWNTQWVPDQDRPIRLMARITDTDGLTTITPIVDGLRFSRDRSVRMYKSSKMPEGFRARLGKKEFCQIEVKDDLGNARAARMIASTHGPHEEPGIIGLNDHPLATIAPTSAGRGVEVYAEFDVPLKLIHTGENTFYAMSETKAHPLAIMWPGPVLLIEFDQKSGTEKRPTESKDE